jgi:hypothetical protein
MQANRSQRFSNTPMVYFVAEHSMKSAADAEHTDGTRTAAE